MDELARSMVGDDEGKYNQGSSLSLQPDIDSVDDAEMDTGEKPAMSGKVRQQFRLSSLTDAGGNPYAAFGLGLFGGGDAQRQTRKIVQGPSLADAMRPRPNESRGADRALTNCKKGDSMPKQASIVCTVRTDPEAHEKRCARPSSKLIAPNGNPKAHIIVPGDWLYTSTRSTDMVPSLYVNGLPNPTVTATVNGLFKSEKLAFLGCAATMNEGAGVPGKRNDSTALLLSTTTGFHTGPGMIQPNGVVAFTPEPFVAYDRNGDAMPAVQPAGSDPTKFVPSTYELASISIQYYQEKIDRTLRAAADRVMDGNNFGAMNFSSRADAIISSCDAAINAGLYSTLRLPGHEEHHPMKRYAQWAVVGLCLAPSVWDRSVVAIQNRTLSAEAPVLIKRIQTLRLNDAAINKQELDALQPVFKLDNSAETKMNAALRSSTAMPVADRSVWFQRNLPRMIRDKQSLCLEQQRTEIAERVMGKSLNAATSGHALNVLNMLGVPC